MAKKKVKIKLNRSGVRQLMRSEEMMSVLKEYGYKAYNQLDASHYGIIYFTGKNRAAVELYASDPTGWRDNYKHNTLLKALK